MTQNKLFGTEAANPVSRNAHAQSTLEVLRGINGEDATIAAAVAQALPSLTMLVDKTIIALKNGGRLYYIGAGTSGRLGVLDASECPPTYGVPEDMVVGIIAGGDAALRIAGEGAEDSGQAGIEAVKHVTANDILVGISASGSAAYVREACKEAKKRGVYTAGISTTPDAPLLRDVDCAILADTGAEYVAGSTRMKSGTAQKMILNMITTATMIGLGKIYAGYMIDVKISNEKLLQRATKMIDTLTGCGTEKAAAIIDAIKGKTPTPVKPGIVMALENVNYSDALKLLSLNDGRIDAVMRKHGRNKILGYD